MAKKKKRLTEVAIEKQVEYKPRARPKWFDRWRQHHPELADQIVELVQQWKTDYELQQAYPTALRLARFISDLPEVDAKADVIRKQEFFS